MSLQKFKFNENNIRVILREAEPWFIALDITSALGYSNGRDAIARHCKSMGVVKHDIPSESGIQSYTIINEPNLYRLILKSQNEQAEPFERWVCEDVLPAIRKTGNYSVTKYNLPTTFQDALRQLAESIDQKEAMQLQLDSQKPKVDFYDAVANSNDTMDMLSVAKILGIGRNRLFAFLRDEKILIKDADSLPYQQYMDAGYFKIIEQKYSTPDGKAHINKKVLVYQKGVYFIQKRLKKFAKK